MTQIIFEQAKKLIERGLFIRQAAREIGFHESTLRVRLKRGQGAHKLGRYRPTLTIDQEKELVNHCIDLDIRFSGLTLKSLRYLLFQYAKENGIHHQFGDKEFSGKDFTRVFMLRN